MVRNMVQEKTILQIKMNEQKHFLTVSTVLFVSDVSLNIGEQQRTHEDVVVGRIRGDHGRAGETRRVIGRRGRRGRRGGCCALIGCRRRRCGGGGGSIGSAGYDQGPRLLDNRHFLCWGRR